jgi:minichromosome maintenance protein 10
MGWGSAFKRGLLEPTDAPAAAIIQQHGTQKKIILSPAKSSLKPAANLEDGPSPRKKARLLLEGKGVRLPGRESLGATPGDMFLEDEDDDLEIVR